MADSPARYSMRGAGAARTHFTSPRSDCRFWASTWPRRLWRWPGDGRDRGIDVEFAACDAFRLQRLGRTFETVLDCGLFHTFDADERPAYVASLGGGHRARCDAVRVVLQRRGPDTGPHPVGREELSSAFGSGWRVAAIEPDRIQTDTTMTAHRPGWRRSNGPSRIEAGRAQGCDAGHR